MPPITFIDMRDREKAERSRLETLLDDLKDRKARDKGLPKSQDDLLEQTEKKLKQEIVDPLFTCIQTLLASTTQNQVPDHKEGRLPQRGGDFSEVEEMLIASYGLLSLDHADPGNARRFPSAFTRALGEYTTDAPLFDRVLDVLCASDDINQKGQLSTSQVAGVFRALRANGTQHDDFNLGLKVRATLAKIGASDDGETTSVVDIDPIDFEAFSDLQIVRDNLLAMQGLYHTAMAEEMQLFRAAEIVLEHWHLGKIVVTRGTAGDRFYNYWRKSSDRFSEIERRSLYARAFGLPGGPAEGQANGEFKRLWVRFLSAVSSFARQSQVDNLLRTNVPAGVSQELVRQTGRDLAANLSVRGYGGLYHSSIDLQNEVKEIFDLLNDEEVRLAYGARDPIQVIEQAVTIEGGSIVNTTQKRISANSGSIVIRWLANHADQLSSIGSGGILSMQTIRNPLPRANGETAQKCPTDADLVNAVEQWLAVNGIGDAYIEEQAQAAEPPRELSRPVAIPPELRSMIPDIPLPMSAGAGNGARHGNGYAHR